MVISDELEVQVVALGYAGLESVIERVSLLGGEGVLLLEVVQYQHVVTVYV